MLLPYTTLVYYGPAALAVESDVSEAASTDLRAQVRVGAPTEGGNQDADMHVTKLLGWGLEVEGQGDVAAFMPRLRVRLGIDVDVAAQPTVFDIVQGILNAQAARYSAAGTIGGKINAQSASGDPWGAALPGAYAPGTAGYIVGSNLDAKLSDTPAQVVASLAETTIPVNMVKVKGQAISGSGIESDPWGPA